ARRRSAADHGPTRAGPRHALHGGAPLVQDLDLTGVDQLLQRGVVGGRRHDLPALSGTEMQLLATRQRNAQRPGRLVVHDLHRGLTFARAYFLSFADSGARLCPACFDFASATPCALAVSFCFWPRCFDFGDLSPIASSVRTALAAVQRSQATDRRARPERARERRRARELSPQASKQR